MTLTCTRLIAFDAAHRVIGHEHRCRHLHGHRYTAEATFAAETLDALGRVVDFGVVRERLGGWIDAHWDHTTILDARDRDLGEAIARETGQAVFYLPFNPTAENMANYLFATVCPDLFAQSGVRCVGVRLWETPNCYADAR